MNSMDIITAAAATTDATTLDNEHGIAGADGAPLDNTNDDSSSTPNSSMIKSPPRECYINDANGNVNDDAYDEEDDEEVHTDMEDDDDHGDDDGDNNPDYKLPSQAPQALPAPTYPMTLFRRGSANGVGGGAGSGGGGPTTTMARYDSFGMDDDDYDDDVDDYDDHIDRDGVTRRGRGGYNDSHDELMENIDHHHHHHLNTYSDDDTQDDNIRMMYQRGPTTSKKSTAIKSFRPFQAPSSSSPFHHHHNNHHHHHHEPKYSKPTTTNLQEGIPTLHFNSLPQDALHTIASFSTGEEWASLSQTCKDGNRACREVFGRVWRHAFRCVQEVCLAWSKGEHTDARELAALYIKNGVPIYPAPNGHAYHTLKWRMGLEIKHTMEGGEGQNDRQEEETSYMNAPGRAAGLGFGDNTNTNNDNGNGNDQGDDNPGGEDAATANNTTTSNQEGPKIELDPFYNERFQTNNNNNNNNHQDRDSIFPRNHTLTYVEEKSLFWKKEKGIPIDLPPPSSAAPSSNLNFNASATFLNHHFNNHPMMPPQGRRHSMNSNIGGGGRHTFRHAWRDTTPRHHHHNDGFDAFPNPFRRTSFTGRDGTPHDRFRPTSTFHSNASSNTPATTTNRYTPPPDNSPKMTLKIHKHLADQHLFGLPSVYDDNGNMNASPMNLNADFFHPQWSSSLSRMQMNQLQDHMHQHFMNDSRNSREGRMDGTIGRWGDNLDLMEGFDGIQDNLWANGGGSADSDDEQRRRDLGMEMDLHHNHHPPRRNFRRGTGRRHSMQMALLAGNSSDAQSLLNASPASDVHLEIYSLANIALKSDPKDKHAQAITRTRVRCVHYQRKLEECLAEFDLVGFEECLLDLWDDMFPTTAGIHFYNRQTPVPRMSNLHNFLMAPCPKALGTMQCEIMRVKSSSKKKGVSVKGRFFPTYEYRLFIRDPKNDNPHNILHYPPRRDSVLLVAKNKSRRNKNAAGGESSGSSSSKRGVTNYYMSLPQQRDVDGHYRSCNPSNNYYLPPGEKSGIAISPLAARSNAPVEVGRLQSNFIGTEFQIFSPSVAKSSRRDSADPAMPSSDEELDGSRSPQYRRASMDAPPAASTNKAHRRGSGLVRLARRASLTMTRRGSMSRNQDGEDPADETEEKRPSRVTRRMSWGPSFPTSVKKSNRNRRAIANSVDSDGVPSLVMGEEECGAITYTANLLGNRPRIMDVCIPKVSEDGCASAEWRGGPDSAAESGENISNSKMLNRFKSIQQRLENAEENAANANGEAAPVDIDDHGLMILQNRPPWWNMELGAFVLNFGGRVSVASVKNFQLCERNNVDAATLLQFGRIQGRHSFTMDFQYPMTPVQAFAIAISSLQSKISFG